MPRSGPPWRPGLAAAALIVAWLGVNAAWGLTSAEDTLVSGWLRRAASLEVWLGGAVALLAGAVALAAGRRKRGLLAITGMLCAYLTGVAASRFAYDVLDPRGGVPFDHYNDVLFAVWERSFLLYPAIPMLAVYLLVTDPNSRFAFRFGDWRAPARFFRERAQMRWSGHLLFWLVVIVAPMFVLMQVQVGFAPITSGRLFVFLPAVIVLALFNAFTEELIFRGFVQRALLAYLGPAAAVLLQAAFFGIHHWGSSPVPGFATVAITFLFGAVWGLSVLQTRGLGWAVCCHTLIDMTFFSAHFVAVPES